MSRSCLSAGRSQSRTTQNEQETQHQRLLPRRCWTNHGPVHEVLARCTSRLDYALFVKGTFNWIIALLHLFYNSLCGALRLRSVESLSLSRVQMPGDRKSHTLYASVTLSTESRRSHAQAEYAGVHNNILRITPALIAFLCLYLHVLDWCYKCIVAFTYVHLGTIASSVKVTGLSRRLTGFNVSFCWLYHSSRLLSLTS